MNSTPAWLSKMLDPATYPHPTRDVRLVQTHISWVFITDEFVYKIKKPVDFGFLDFTTLEKRKTYVSEELRLNKRLCPEIYLECIPLREKARGGFSLGGEGDIVEWVLKMHRMPEEGMMRNLIQAETLDRGHLNLLVERLVPFYESAETGGWVDEFGTMEAVRYNVQENFQQTREYLGTHLDPEKYHWIQSYNEAFFKENQHIFGERIRSSRIREGHGDLYSANICFDEAKGAVYVFDCIEFNRRFRCGDVASDLAFLAMDLDYHGLPGLAIYFQERFVQESRDEGLVALMDFYKCYRAFVRAKIGCFTSSGPGIPEETRRSAMEEARNYLSLAYRYAGGLRGTRPRLYCFMGLSGTGKTTLATAFSERLGLRCYSSDVVRKEIIAGIPKEEKRIEPFGHGIYSPEMSRRTYRSLKRHAAQHLLRGEPVCLDATYISSEERRRLLELEEETGCKVCFVLCELREERIRERLLKREQEGAGISDGRYEIYLRQKEEFSPLSQDEEKRTIRVDTGKAQNQTLKTLLELLRF